MKTKKWGSRPESRIADGMKASLIDWTENNRLNSGWLDENGRYGARSNMWKRVVFAKPTKRDQSKRISTEIINGIYFDTNPFDK